VTSLDAQSLPETGVPLTTGPPLIVNLGGSGAPPPDKVLGGRDKVRLIIVWFLFSSLTGTITWCLALASCHYQWPVITGLLGVLLPAETALAGSAVAFYMTGS
jgi:hypothetical protein